MNWSRLPILVLSFIISLVLYLYVQIVNFPANPVKTMSTASVTVNKLNLPPNLYADIATSIPVRISGSAADVNSALADKNDIVAEVNFAGAKPGTRSYKVTITKPQGMKAEVAPVQSMVPVTVDVVVTRQIPVTVRPANTLPGEFVYLGAVTSPKSVTVTGPESLISNAQAVANLDLHSIQKGQLVQVHVEVMDGKGFPLGDLARLSPDQVTVRPSINEAPVQKPLLVNVEFVGQVANGYRVTDYSVKPTAVMVTGESGAIAGLSTLTVKVDLTGLTANKDFQLTPLLPPGVREIQTSPITVSVAVSLIPPASNP